MIKTNSDMYTIEGYLNFFHKKHVLVSGHVSGLTLSIEGEFIVDKNSILIAKHTGENVPLEIRISAIESTSALEDGEVMFKLMSVSNFNDSIIIKHRSSIL